MDPKKMSSPVQASIAKSPQPQASPAPSLTASVRELRPDEFKAVYGGIVSFVGSVGGRLSRP